MDALSIQKAYRKIIARYIVNERNVTAALSAGSTIIPVESARRFTSGEKIVVFDPVSYRGEIAVIDYLPDRHNIVVESGLQSAWPSSAVVRKLLGYESGVEQYIQGIYLGDPAVISHFPAITINIKSRSSEWLTLESTKETYNIDITIFVQGAQYDQQYEMMHAYVDAIERALYRSLYPLVEPYFAYPLLYPVGKEDYIFQIDGPDFVCGSMLFFESLDHLIPNMISQNLGNGVYRTRIPMCQDFDAGDKVIWPRRHIFNSMPQGTQYGTINKGTMLKAAVISVVCEEEVRRFAPYIDPLTF